MKRFALILLTAILMLPVSAVAKSVSVDDLYKEFSSAPEAEAVSIPPFLMKLAKLCMKGKDQDAKIVRKINSVRVLDLEDCSKTVKSRFANRVSNIQLKDMEELMDVRDDGDKVKILAKIKKDKISKLLILCYGNDDCCLVEVNGKFEMNDIDDVVKSQKPRHNGRR